MSRQPPNKLVGQYDRADVDQGTFIDAALIPIGPNGTILAADYGDLGSFLLNPDTYEETHATGWVANSVPGQSLPVYQWVAGGPRVVTFEAFVTKDTSYLNKNSKPRTPLSQLKSKGINALGTIASNFLGAPIPTSQLLSAFGAAGTGNEFDLDISEYLEYYRMLWQPTYDGNRIAQSPPLVYLYAGDTFEPVSDQDKVIQNSQVFVVTNLSIKITKQLPNLTPMEAIVTFQLEQYPITSVGKSNFGNSTVGG